MIISFDNAAGGSYRGDLGSGSVLAYYWIQDPYRGRLFPIIFSGVPAMDLRLDYDSATAGTFKGTAYPNYPSSAGSFATFGTFSSTP